MTELHNITGRKLPEQVRIWPFCHQSGGRGKPKRQEPYPRTLPETTLQRGSHNTVLCALNLATELTLRDM